MAALIDMHDLGDALVQTGFADPVMDQEVLTLSWSSAAAALAELRQWGGNGDASRQAGLRTPRWRERLHQALEQGTAAAPGRRPAFAHGASGAHQPQDVREAQEAHANLAGKVRLEVEIVYGHAFKVMPGIAMQAETRVSAEQLRAQLKARGR